MDSSLTQRIRERAYELWTASGCPMCHEEQHWLAAEHEILHAPKRALASRPAAVKRSRRQPGKSAKQTITS